jgi:hypothetical protein
MKIILKITLFCLPFLLIINCGRHANTKIEPVPADTITVPDTGFTGIKQYFSGPNLIYEATLKNGVRHGLMKSFYLGGLLRNTYWYENGLLEDSAKWYRPEGYLFRSTPYQRDTVHGIQVQYFRTGRTRAKIGFEKGHRTFFFEEYMQNGQLVRNYPDVVVKTTDNYNANGTYNISLELSNASKDVKFVRGDFSKGVYDSTAVAPIRTVNGVGSLTLRKSSAQTKPYIEILAEILTGHGNRYLSVKRIDLPYNDLN